MLIDSHCHIDGEAFDADRDEVVARAHKAGVAAMLNVGTGDPHSDDFRKAVAVAEKYENVYASVGVHPHDAKLYDDKAEAHLVDLAKSEKVIAWGEIGLDYYYDHSPREVQQEVFRRQIEVAKDLNLPVIVHSRDADDDTLSILTEAFSEAADSRKLKAESSNIENSHQLSAISHQQSRGIMHCFGGTPEMARELMEIGFLISSAGNVTFKKAENLRDAAKVVPLDRLLIETDCPFLTPEPNRGKRNEPAFVVHTARFLADFYGIEFETLADQTSQNFIEFFGRNVETKTTDSLAL